MKFEIDVLIVNIKQEAEITEHELETISKQKIMPDSPHITKFSHS